jgi:hypothetical protein
MNIGPAVAVIAALALAGCGGKSTPAADTPDVPASSATAGQSASTPAPASPAAPSPAPASPATDSPASAPAKGEKPSREFVVGKWGTNGDCTLAIDLRPDGTSDGPFGKWAYNDGVISFPEDPEFKVTVTVIDSKTMESTNGEGKTAQMTRCP